MPFWKRNLACVKLGIRARSAYPIDFFVAIVLAPLSFFLVEAAFWSGLIEVSGKTSVAGFSKADYLSYFLWLTIGLGSLNWRFERSMIAEINNGAINARLLRPSSFFEYHLGQLLGQKLLSLCVMLPIILLIAWIWPLPFYLERVPAALLMGVLYVILLFSLHFAVACMAFFFDHVYSLNVTKNMLLWFLTGDLMPLDLIPSPVREWVMALPFSCGFYLPAAYISGRISTPLFLSGFLSLAWGGLLFAWLAQRIWWLGLRRYTGTGA